MSALNLTNSCDKSTIEISTIDLCHLQLSCMDRISNLKDLAKAAESRNEVARAGRLKGQLDRVEDLLCRLVQL